MRRARRAAAAVLGLLLAAGPAAAVELTTTIDLDYLYEQENTAGDVQAEASYRQKYEVKYETTSAVFDYAAAARLELEDVWRTDDATASRLAPTLELVAKGLAVTSKLSYQGVISRTGAFREQGEAETYSTNAQAEVQLTPLYWPEARLKVQRKRNLEPGANDAAERTLELGVRKDIAGLVLEYDFQRVWSDDTLPERGTMRSAEWKGKATYKHVLWGETEFELSYQIDDDYQRDTARDVFVSDSESSGQELKSRLQKTIALTSLSELKLGWEYLFEQDFTGEEFDAKVSNKYQAVLRYDPFSSVKLAADVRRETRDDRYEPPQEDEAEVVDGLILTADLEPLTWLRVASKADVRWEQETRDATGRSVDRRRTQKYETVARAKFGEAADLTVNGATTVEDEDGWTTSREAKFRGELEYKAIPDLKVKPSYEVIRLTEWAVRIPGPEMEQQSREWEIQFEYNRQLVDLFRVVFQHGYGVKTEEAVDAALDFQRTVQLNEQTRISLVVADLIAGLKIEGVVDRRAADVQDDEEPMIVDVAFAVKLDYKHEFLNATTSLKYNDKGDAFDDLTFNAKLEWRGEELTLASEYQFTKVYAEETDEDRKLNLKLSYTF